MKISKQELIDMGACECDGLIERFKLTTDNTDKPIDIISLIGGSNSYEDLLWLAVKMGLPDRVVRFACDCALIKIELIKPYCDDKEYESINMSLDNPSDSFVEYAWEAALKTAAAMNGADFEKYYTICTVGFALKSAAWAEVWEGPFIEPVMDVAEGEIVESAAHAVRSAASSGVLRSQLNGLMEQIFS